MHLFRFLVPCLISMFVLPWFAVAAAQTAQGTLPTATTTQGIEALTHTIESLIELQYDSFEVEVETVSATTKGDFVDADFRVTIRRDEAYLVEVAKTLLPFNGACHEPMRCATVRFFGTGEPFGRAGFVDVAIPDEESGVARTSLFSSLTVGFNYENKLAVVVELQTAGGQPVGRAVEYANEWPLFPLGMPGHISSLNAEQVRDLLGPYVVKVKLTDVPLTLWNRATNVQVTLMGGDVRAYYNLSSPYAFSAGLYLPEEDAAELFVEPGILVFDEDSRWDSEGSLITPSWIGHLPDDAAIITHVDGDRVTSAESLADALFRAPPVFEFTVWQKKTDSTYEVKCEAYKWDEPPIYYLPTEYPIEAPLVVYTYSEYGSMRTNLERGVRLDMLVLGYDCTDLW